MDNTVLLLLMKLEVAERTLDRIALNIHGDIVPQVLAGEATRTMRFSDMEGLQNWLAFNKPLNNEPLGDEYKEMLKQALAEKYL